MVLTTVSNSQWYGFEKASDTGFIQQVVRVKWVVQVFYFSIFESHGSVHSYGNVNIVNLNITLDVPQRYRVLAHNKKYPCNYLCDCVSPINENTVMITAACNYSYMYQWKHSLHWFLILQLYFVHHYIVPIQHSNALILNALTLGVQVTELRETLRPQHCAMQEHACAIANQEKSWEA